MNRVSVALMMFAAVILAARATSPPVGAAPPQDEGPKIGTPAPAIEGTDPDGKPIKLADFKGKVVLLDFFGDW